jgi:hypothetical protein
MDMNQIEARLSALEKELAEAKIEIARHESAQQIANLMCRYENLHSSHRWKEQEECFALKTPGVRAIFNGAVYEGADGIRSHYTGLLQEAEKNVSGRLYAHELLTPAIEVAKDNESAKAYFSSLGFETLVMPDGRRKSLWSFCKFRFGFVREDGEWKIYRFDMHGTFNTPFDGPGWSEEPYLIGFANTDVDNSDPRWSPNAVINRDPDGNPLYVTLRTDTPYCDIHNFQPEFIKPYDTWDEGWDELYSGRKFKPKGPEAMSALKKDPKAAYVKEPFRTPAKPEEYPELWVIPE